LSKFESDVRKNLIQAYNKSVDQREGRTISEWKMREREKFLRFLHENSVQTLIDVGCGPGIHAVYFRENGLRVTCVDLSPEMVARCTEKNFDAYVCDVVDLAALGKTFDAVFTMNSLLHVPRTQMIQVLKAIRDTLTQNGLFYWGQYGGEEWEGVREDDDYEPKRFFSFMEDEKITQLAEEIFLLEEFTPVYLEDADSFHFQSLILRAKDR